MRDVGVALAVDKLLFGDVVTSPHNVDVENNDVTIAHAVASGIVGLALSQVDTFIVAVGMMLSGFVVVVVLHLRDESALIFQPEFSDGLKCIQVEVFETVLTEI
ncbi:hypothetical protein WJ86_14480 [Burkholderia multivorans]|nr:hypothetical protein WJ86_14480 [Burkholderia multivorans]